MASGYENKDKKGRFIMKKIERLNGSARKTAAFVSAFVMLFGMTCTALPYTPVKEMPVFAAEETVAGSLTVSGSMFGLNKGDSVQFYAVKTNQYGNTETRMVTSVSGSDADTAVSAPADGEQLFAKRYIRKGSESGVQVNVDYYAYSPSGNSWTYIGANNWENMPSSPNLTTVSATREKFGLSVYDAPENEVKQDRIQIYSTTLDSEGNKNYIGELTGKDTSDISLLISKNKNTGYIAIRTQGGIAGSLDNKMDTVSMYRYDMDKGDWVRFYDSLADKQSSSFNTMTLFVKKETFPMLADADVQEIRIYRTVDGEKTLIKTIDKTAFDKGYGAVDQKFDNDTMGFAIGNTYEEYSWEADVYRTFSSDYVTVRDAQLVSGKFLANIPYATNLETASSETSLIDIVEKTAVVQEVDSSGRYILPELAKAVSDEDGDGVEDTAQSRPIYMTDEFAEIEAGQHGNVYLMKGTDVIESYTAGEFDNGCFNIPEFEPDEDYFLKISHTESEENPNNYATYYKWDEEAGKWRFRVNTEETPVVNVPVTHAEITPFMKGDFSVALNLVTGGKSSPVGEWSKKEFDAGTINPALMLQTTGEYEVVLTWEKTEDSGNYGTEVYKYVGIDPVLCENEFITEISRKFGNLAPSSAPVTAPITNAKEDDTITVDGFAEDGNPVHYEIKQNVTNGTVKLPEGDFTVTDTTAGYKAGVEVTDSNGTVTAAVTDKSSVDSRYVNVTVPVEVNTFKVTAPDGSLVEEGKMKGTSLKASDLSMSANDFKKMLSYAGFSSEFGFVNSANENDLTTENGYLGVISSKITKVVPESSLKGDIDADGKVTVKDIVLMNKYLHGKSTYQLENFVNADMNSDGAVNVYDMALLKKELLKK